MFRVAGYVLRVTDFELRVTRYAGRVTGCGGSNFSNSVCQSCPPYEALNTEVSLFIKLAILVAKSRADTSAG